LNIRGILALFEKFLAIAISLTVLADIIEPLKKKKPSYSINSFEKYYC
jgi:hypothetical protein